MADDDSAKKSIEAPLTSFVKGGTVSLSYENDLKQKRAAAEARRQEEASRLSIAKSDSFANVSTVKLGGAGSHAGIVLEIKDSDRNTTEAILCELTVDRDDPKGEGLILVLCCPYCAQKYGSDEAQMTIRSRHRHFELDRRREGELWVNPLNPNQFVRLAGTIQLTEAVRCPGLGCTWRFRIDDSIVRPL